MDIQDLMCFIFVAYFLIARFFVLRVKMQGKNELLIWCLTLNLQISHFSGSIED